MPLAFEEEPSRQKLGDPPIPKAAEGTRSLLSSRIKKTLELQSENIWIPVPGKEPMLLGT